MQNEVNMGVSRSRDLLFKILEPLKDGESNDKKQQTLGP